MIIKEHKGHDDDQAATVCRVCLDENLDFPLAPGCSVEITALKKAAQLNGKIGTLVRPVDGTDRWAVSIWEDPIISIRECNLIPTGAKLLSGFCACRYACSCELAIRC